MMATATIDMATEENSMTMETDKSLQAYTVLERSVCLTLRTHIFGNNRKVDLKKLVGEQDPEDEDAAEVSEDVFHATKRLLDPKVLRPAHRVLGKAKHLIRANSIAAHRVFGDGTALVPVVKAEEVDAGLEELAAELVQEGLALGATYETAKEEQRKKLGPHFNPDDYMTREEVERAFSIDWAYVSFAAPDRLESVSKVLADKANEKHKSRLADAYEETVLQLRRSALAVMQDLVGKLGQGKDGKLKTLRGSALDDLLSFCERLPSLNSIAGDDALTEAVAAVQAQVQGTDVQALRDSAALREALADTVQQAADTLEGLVTVQRGRGLALGGL